MIKVSPAQEPITFQNSVRSPGAGYLASLNGGAPDFRGREYWRNCIAELHKAYNSICAYTCHWIPIDTGSDTVEHFIPKSVNAAQAYEWSNFRLVCGRLNSRKGAHQDVADPFTLKSGMFQIHFPSLNVVADPGLRGADASIAASTLTRLKLNDKRCVDARLEWLRQYAFKNISMKFLQQKAPFLAMEVKRQKLSPPMLKKDMFGS